MRPEHPDSSRIPGLRSLWKKAFGDTDAFLDLFFSTAYAPERCRCITEQEAVAAALYWLDATCGGQKYAYIYAVATDPDHRGKGLCRRLMEDTAQVLKAAGYDGILLVPQDENLRIMYGKMGYETATHIGEKLCVAAPCPAPVREIGPEEYAAKRSAILPAGSVLQKGAALDFLGKLARFYVGDGFLAAVSRETEHLRILEYLGSQAATSALVAALGHTEATVRYPGADKPFAMYLPLTPNCKKPKYFAFCFD